MARRSSGPAFTSTPAEAEVAEYRPLCGLAVVALLVGVLSAMAIFATLFWFLPVLGIVLGAVALRRIATSDPPLVGRTAALVGLGLSLAFAVAAPTDFVYYRWNLRQEAQKFGLLWFQLLANGEPEKACQLHQPPSARQPLDDRVWEQYPADSDPRAMLEGLVGQRVVHALLLLGEAATVCYYDTDAQWTAEDRDYVAQSFAVTFASAGGETQTFFVRLVMERSQVAGQRRGFWRVRRAEGDIMPVALGGKAPQV